MLDENAGDGIRFSLLSMQGEREQEEAAAGVIDLILEAVLEPIRDRELERIARNRTADLVADDVARIYAAIDIRYDPGDEIVATTSPSATAAHKKTNQESIDTSDDHRRRAGNDFAISTAGALWPSSEPVPPKIDRWARGWVESRHTARDWSRIRHDHLRSSDNSSDGGRSIRSTRSMCAMSSGKKHTQPRSHLEQMPAVPFPLGPDNREDQSLPPEIPLHSRKRQVVGAGGGHGDSRGRSGRSGKRERSGGRGGLGVAAGNGVDERSVFSGDEGTQMTKDAEDFESRVKALGGREWTIDDAGELLVVERPKGDTMPKTTVSAMFNFRDAALNRDVSSASDCTAGGQPGVSNVLGGSNARSSDSLAREEEIPSSASRRVSRRRSSQRAVRKKRGSSRFFALEPTLQPNLTTLLDRPGPGVLVCDGSSTKEGPSWPQDPAHMSRNEFQQRQRSTASMSANDISGGNGGNLDDMSSSLGFSLGSVQSAPTMGGFALGLNGESKTRGGRRGQKLKYPRGGTGGSAPGGGGVGAGSGSGRGDSFSAFNNLNPLSGGVRVPSAIPSSHSRRGFGAGSSSMSRGGDEGGFSPLSLSIDSDSAFPSRSHGPESSLGWEEEESTDPHALLMKDPEWGQNTRGPPKQAGLLPKVKHMPRERPLTHERPHTRNPRDPRNVLAREKAHVSPKSINNSTTNIDDKSYMSDKRSRHQNGASEDISISSSLFPSLPTPLQGWGMPSFKSYGSPSGRVGGKGGGGGLANGRGGGASGLISMAKPREILVEGLLR